MLNIMGIGIGEGGGRIAQSMIDCGVSICAINSNAGDLAGLGSVPENKKLLLKISDGGSGKDPQFVKDSLKSPEYRDQIVSFIKKQLISTPIFSYCTNCHAKNKLKDSESIGMSRECTECGSHFGITEIFKEENLKHDYIFLFACLGGGSGSGLIEDIAEICHENFDTPIGAIVTIPTDDEDSITKRNAVSIFKEMYDKYAVPGIISPFMLVDNQKMVEMYNLPIGSMYSTINHAITRSIYNFNSFSNKTSKYMSTVDTMDTARLWSLGGCCTIGKFTIGKTNSKANEYVLNVPNPSQDNYGMIDDYLRQCTFVDGFDLSSAKGVGIIAVAPEHYMSDVNISKAIKFTFAQVKDIIGDGLIMRGQYEDASLDCLEFYVFYNGLSYPKERFNRLWNDIKEGMAIEQRKRDRVEDIPYDISLSSPNEGNFRKLKDLKLDKPQVVEVTQKIKPEYMKKKCDNCLQDPTTKLSLGIYKKGGPMPFSGKICPRCKGTGRV
jgi:cell division GTPase FtsZ